VKHSCGGQVEHMHGNNYYCRRCKTIDQIEEQKGSGCPLALLAIPYVLLRHAWKAVFR
jgi:hypothetical protein